MASTITLKLLVTNVELCRRTPLYPSRWTSSEQYELYLNVEAIDEGGDVVYFNTPAIEMRVASGPGVAVVTYYGTGPWITPGENYCITAGGEPVAKRAAAPQIQVDDILTITCRVKKEYANRARRVSHVKLVENCRYFA